MNGLDLRLVPALSALWLGSIIGLHTRVSAPGITLTAVAVAGSVLLRRHRLAATWALALLLGLVLAALRADAASPHAIEEAIDRAGLVHFTAVIESEPSVVERQGFGGLVVEPVVMARATLLSIDADADRWRLAVPVTVQWADTATVPAIGRHVGGEALIRRGDVAARSAFWISVRGSLSLGERETHGAWLANAVRNGLADAVHADSGGDGATLLPGLVLGDTRAQSARLVDDLRVSGLSHLTSVSGANLAIVVGALAWALGRTRMRRHLRHLLLLLAMLCFVAVVRPQPSVLRAAMMGALSLYALATGVRRASASVLWLSVCLLLVLDPFLAWQWGFALSVAATAGLVLLGPHVSGLLPGRAGALLGVTLAAQLATLPVLLAMGRPPTWLSVPANVLCEPLVAPATVFGFLAALVAAVGLLPGLAAPMGAVAMVVAWPGVLLASVIAWIAHVGAGTPLAVAPIGGILPMLGVIAVVLVLMRFGVGRRGLAALAAAALVFTVCFPDGMRRWPNGDWWYVMCDVGQGDSSVVNLGGGAALVIDVGPDPAAERRCLRQLGVHRIVGLFLTHFHADHVEGLSGALAQADVQRVFATPIREPGLEWSRVRAQLAADPIEVQRGSSIRFGDTRVDVLWPDPAAASGDPNNASLVLDVAQRGRHLLVTGDADAPAQAALALPVSQYAVLKVPHHGSRFRDPDFLRRVHPVLALVSVGAGNDYGHPAAETVAELRALGARVLRTDLVGSIAIAVRDDRLAITTLSG